MPQVPKTCPATGQPVPKDYLHTLDGHFLDTSGRTVLLRGVNLSGSSKAPVGQPSHIRDEFWLSAQAGKQNFLGRPLNLDDGSADVHLSRLRRWGFNLLRFPVTWEALEHEGPGQYDHEFMDYTIRVLYKCKEYGFRVFIDPHQDVWSRFSGGSGAPYWTFPACGIDPQAFTATQAAILHCEYPDASDTPTPAALPSMIWSTNYGRLASQSMFTLFFAGKTFAPKCYLDGIHIQDYLQSHFIRAFGVLADRIRNVGGLLDDVVIGWDSLNEPSEGFIGWEDLSAYPSMPGSVLKKGSVPTPLQSLKLGMGFVQTLDKYVVGSLGPQRNGTVTVDPKGARIWADPSTELNGVHPKWGWKRSSEWTLGTCIWAIHGVWDVASGTLLKPGYFRCYPSAPLSSDVSADRTPVHFREELFLPHLIDYFTRIRTAHPSAIAFVQPPSLATPPPIPESLLKGRGCNSTHYYDGLTLLTRRWQFFNVDTLGIIRGKYSSPIFGARFGERAIRASLRTQLGTLKSDTAQLGSDAQEPRRYPTIIGEIGVPMDMDEKKAYDPKNRRYGDYTNQERALDASLNATDGPNVLNYAMWTYCPDNSHVWADGWNMEDFSLWSEDDIRGKTTDIEGVVAGPGSLALARVSSETMASLESPTLLCEGVGSSHTMTPMSSHEVLKFSRDGARAIRAFCRPYPVKVVGTPVDVQFDISAASLKLKIRVTPADAPQTEARGREEGWKGTNGQGGSTLSTEIYIPLVHFASDACVEGSVAMQNRGQQADLEDLDDRSSTLALALSKSKLLAYGKAETINTEGYAMQIKVSEGRVEVDESEQTLHWFYSVPMNGDKEVSMEVKRLGGAIEWATITRRKSSGTRNWWHHWDVVSGWVEQLRARLPCGYVA